MTAKGGVFTSKDGETEELTESRDSWKRGYMELCKENRKLKAEIAQLQEGSWSEFLEEFGAQIAIIVSLALIFAGLYFLNG